MVETLRPAFQEAMDKAGVGWPSASASSQHQTALARQLRVLLVCTGCLYSCGPPGLLHLISVDCVQSIFARFSSTYRVGLAGFVDYEWEGFYR